MRRKPFRKQAVSVALFPFLGVLICTMGSLILLLVILVQHARVEADTIKAEHSRGGDDEAVKALELKREDAAWRKEVLLQARQENVEKLAQRRLELSHLDDHIRELQDRWQQLTRQADELQQLSQNRAGDTAATRAELARLQTEIEAAEQQLEAARQRAGDRPRSFAIVPTPRKNGTLRRPIYVECTSQGVILQPEGLVLGPRDFIQPLGPGNALDTALRATREYLARHGGVTQHGEPYPLLLVRPDGAVAYAAAREALRSWDDEFGYELLDADMQLAYPDVDPHLAAEVRRAVDLARRRKEALAESAPTRYRQLLGQGGEDRVGGGFQPSGQSPQPGADGPYIPGGSNERPNNVAAPDATAIGAGGQHQNVPTPAAMPRTDDGSARPDHSNPHAAESTKPGPETYNGGGNGGPVDSIAQQRGQNWALGGGKSPRANAYARPVRVACSADQLVVFPEPRSNQRIQILTLRGATQNHVDEFVAVVQRTIELWGTPPVRGYWQPVLSIEVAPGGERRYEDLRKLLSGSGLEVERK